MSTTPYLSLVGGVPLIGRTIPQETTVCSSKGQALQFASTVSTIFFTSKPGGYGWSIHRGGKMKIAITGAGGFVGKELRRFFSARHHVLALTRQSLDITDRHAVRRMITDIRPDLIINCAVLGVDDW